MISSSMSTGPHPGGRDRSGRRAVSIRRRAVPAGLCAALVLVAGCGAAGVSPAAKPLSARQAITLAADASQRINSETAEMAVQVGGSTSGSMSGTIQLQLKPTLLANAQFKVAASGQDIAIGEILTGGAIYVKIPGLTGIPGHAGKPWLKVSLGQLTGTAESQVGQLIQGIQNSNAQNLTRLFTASKNVRATGTQTIDGVRTTRYTGTFTPSAASAALPASLRKLMGPELKLLQGPVRFTVWIDGQHHTRKLIETEKIAGQSVVTNLTVTAINQPVHVTVPPASQVMTMPSDLFGNGASSSSSGSGSSD